MERDGLGFEHSKGNRNNDCICSEDTGAARMGGSGMDLHPWGLVGKGTYDEEGYSELGCVVKVGKYTAM